MLDAVLDLVPVARVGFVGIYRDERTLEPVEYYSKLPGDLGERDVIVLDPMLATGGSASHAITLCKRSGARRVVMVALVAVPEGVARLERDHPEVQVVAAALDRELDEQGYILPGLGMRETGCTGRGRRRPTISPTDPIRCPTMNGGLIDSQAAVVGFAVAFLLAVLLTPVVSQAAWLTGVVDVSRDGRRLHSRPTPLLGGVAIFAAIAIPSLALGHDHGFWGIMAGAALMSALGALDDIRPLPPAGKMAGMVAIAAIPVSLGVTIDHITLPLVGAFDLGPWQYPITVLWIVAIANIVNFIDGLDGLAAGFCAIAALTFAVLSASLGRGDAAAISAIVAGAAFGFLIFNFSPATIFMGDSGSLMLGYLLAALAIQGVLKTAAAVSLVLPLMILALPILDTSFVILKRLEVRAADLPGRPLALPPPLLQHRVLAAAHRPLPVRLVRFAVGAGAGDPVRAQPSPRLGPAGGGGAGGAGTAGRGDLAVRRLPARDHQGAAPASASSAPREARRGRATKRAGRVTVTQREFRNGCGFAAIGTCIRGCHIVPRSGILHVPAG